MSAAIASNWSGIGAERFEQKAATREPAWVKWLVIAISLSFFALFLLLPLVAVTAGCKLTQTAD